MLNESLAKPSGLIGFRAYVKREDPDEAYFEAEARLKEHGWKRLGGGMSGAAYYHPSFPKMALKVYSLSDKGYTTWLRFCKLNQNNPYVPKMFGSLVKVSGKIGGVRLELLRPIASSDHDYLHLGKQVVLADLETISDPNLKAVASFLRPYVRVRGIVVDWHDKNVMRHPSTRHLVITDPLVG